MWALLMEMGQHKDREKTLTRVGIEPTTFGLDHRCSTDWDIKSYQPPPFHPLETKNISRYESLKTSPRGFHEGVMGKG